MFVLLIHSVAPAHMMTEQQHPETRFQPFEGGYLEGFDTENGFQISRLCSTDPSFYLKYSPGGIYQKTL